MEWFQIILLSESGKVDIESESLSVLPWGRQGRLSNFIDLTDIETTNKSTFINYIISIICNFMLNSIIV